MKSMIAFKTMSLFVFVIFTLIKGFPLRICNMPKEHLSENRENLQKHDIMKLGYSPDYAGFEASFKSAM